MGISRLSCQSIGLTQFSLLSSARELWHWPDSLSQGLVCCIFSLITTLDALVTMTVFVSWLFYAFCFVAVVVLRMRKNAKKPSFYVSLTL